MRTVLGLDNSKKVRKIVFLILAFNLSLTGLKFTIGLFGNSQALVADAIHSLADAITDLVVIIGSYFWGKPPDEDHPHGHQRIETLVTIVVALFILAAGIGMSWHAIITIDQQFSVSPSSIALVMVFVSMLTQEYICRFALKFGRKYSSSALIASAFEHRTDAISSIPAFFAILGAIVFPDLRLLDNIGAIIGSIFIINTAFKILAPRIQEVLEQGAPAATLEKIIAIVKINPDALDIHKLRTRYLGSNLLLDFHMVVDANITICQAHKIAADVRQSLFNALPDLSDVVVHLEPDSLGVGDDHKD